MEDIRQNGSVNEKAPGAPGARGFQQQHNGDNLQSGFVASGSGITGTITSAITASISSGALQGPGSGSGGVTTLITGGRHLDGTFSAARRGLYGSFASLFFDEHGMTMARMSLERDLRENDLALIISEIDMSVAVSADNGEFLAGGNAWLMVKSAHEGR